MKKDHRAARRFASRRNRGNKPTEYKKPSRFVQNNHSEDPIISNKNVSVGTKRRLLTDGIEWVHFSLLSQIEPIRFDEAKTNEHWVKAMEEELS